MDDQAMTAEGNDTFECTFRVDERFPNDFHEWPDQFRKASEAAVAGLLLKHSGAIVVSDTSECVDDTHPRFPCGDENKGKFWLIRTIRLDQSVEDEPVRPSAAARLRAFEDKHLGKDAVRIHGHVEKGFGSKFKAMPEAKHRHYAALEKLVSTEARLADAHTKLLQAEADHEAALAAANAAESETDGDE